MRRNKIKRKVYFNVDVASPWTRSMVMCFYLDSMSDIAVLSISRLLLVIIELDKIFVLLSRTERTQGIDSFNT